MQGAHFYMGAHKYDVVVPIKIGVWIHDDYFVWVSTNPHLFFLPFVIGFLHLSIF